MIKYLPLLLLLTGCSSGVVIHDGEQDMLIGNERVKSGCYVKVSGEYTGSTSYESDTCKITVTSPQ